LPYAFMLKWLAIMMCPALPCVMLWDSWPKSDRLLWIHSSFCVLDRFFSLANFSGAHPRSITSANGCTWCHM